MNQLFFVHGGDSLKPGEDFFGHWESDASWKVDDPFVRGEKKKRWKDDLAERLGAEWGCAFSRFPNDMDAHYEQWRWWCGKHTPFMKDGIVLVGHSLGGLFLAKYLSENQLPVSVAQLHLVAPAWSEGDFVLGDNLSLVSQQASRIFLYHSEDDPVVSVTCSERYAACWPSAEFVRFTDRGHFFSQESFPELVERILAAQKTK